MVKQISGTLTITLRKQDENYTIEADGPKGIKVDPQHAPQLKMLLSDQGITDTLKDLSSQTAPATTEAIQKLGKALFDSLFTNQNILLAFGKAQGIASADSGMRLRLQIEPAELAALPWETLHDGKDWLSTQSTTPLVRKLALSENRKTLQKLQIRGALRVLFVGASPEGLNDLKVETTANELETLLAAPIKKKQIAFSKLLNATLEELQQELLKDYHILYFAGHGSPEGIFFDDGEGDAIKKEGKVIGRERGEKSLVSAETLADALKGKQTRLVFLAVCETSKASNKTPEGSRLLRGFAQELANRSNLPAIVAMQYFITDMQANSLTTQFFAALAAGHPVDVAMAEARSGLIKKERVNRDVFSPVLYLQVDDGALFPTAKNWPFILTLGVALIAILVGGAFARSAEINQVRDLTSSSKAKLASGSGLDAVIDSLRARKKLKQIFLPDAKLRDQVRETLQKVVYGVQERDRLEQHEAKMISGLSADGRQLANLKQYGFDCSWDNLVCLWDKSGEQMVKFLGSQRHLTGNVFSPDRSKLITVSSKDGGGFIEDNTSIVRLWDLNRNELVADFKGHQSEVLSVSFSPDGNRIAIAGDDGISLWDLNGNQIPEFQGGQGRVTDVTFSPDGTKLASVIDSTSSEGYQNVRFWNLKGQQVGQLKGDLLIDTVIFSPDGTQLATTTTRQDTGGKGNVRLWDLSGNQVSQFRTFGSVVFSSDGGLLSGSGEDGVPRVWNLSGHQLFELKGHQGLASGKIFSPDGKQLVTTGDDKIIRLWDLNDKAAGKFGASGGTFKMILSLDGSLVATYKDNAVSLWDLQGNKLGEVPTNKSAYIPQNITISPDNQQLAIVEGDNIARLWNWRNKQQLEEFTKPQASSLIGISFSGDRSLLVMTGQDKTVRMWNWTGEQVAQFKDLQGQSNRIILSPDNSRIVTIENGNLLLWNLEGKQIAQVNSALNKVDLDDRYIGDNVILSRNNKLVAINGKEGITVWNWNGKQVARFQEGHAMDFSPDGRLLATNQNLTDVVRLLDLTSGRQVAEYPTPAHFAVQFSPDGKWLFTGGNDVPQLWRVESLDDLMVRGCDWVRDYLANNLNVAERDRHLCDGIGSRK